MLSISRGGWRRVLLSVNKTFEFITPIKKYLMLQNVIHKIQDGIKICFRHVWVNLLRFLKQNESFTPKLDHLRQNGLFAYTFPIQNHLSFQFYTSWMVLGLSRMNFVQVYDDILLCWFISSWRQVLSWCDVDRWWRKTNIMHLSSRAK